MNRAFIGLIDKDVSFDQFVCCSNDGFSRLFWPLEGYRPGSCRNLQTEMPKFRPLKNFVEELLCMRF
jgi:hypothetical protein